MRKRNVIFILLALLVLPCGLVFAQAPTTGTEGKKVRVGKTVYDFDEVDILGKLKRPESQSIVEPPEFRFKRLLDLDESFLPNIVRSADEF